MTLVDTSAWIEYLRGTGSGAHRATHWLISGGQAAWCDIVILELLNGVTAAEAARVNRLRRSIWLLEIDTGTWRTAHTLVFKARRNSVTAPLPDIIVEACARSYEVSVLHHGDTHFDDLSKIEI